MQASILPFQYGWYWINYGLQSVKKQPMTFIFWALVTNLLINLSYFIPIIGQIALMVLTPSLTFVILNASRKVLQGERILLGDWLTPLKTDGSFSRLLRLGGIYFICLFIASVLATTPFMDSISAALPTDEDINAEALLQAIRTPVIIFLCFYFFITILFWHAPALVGWHRVPIKQALFYSMVACWRNKLPMIIYAAFWGAVYYLFHLLSEVLVSILGADFSYFLLTLFSLLIFAVLYSTFYPIYHTVFNIQDEVSLPDTNQD